MTQLQTANQKDPMQVFRERVLEKLRADIAGMLPDEALAGLVQQAVKEQFFEPVVRTDSYHRTTETRPSWFVQEVAKIGEPIIHEHIKQWMADNRAAIDEGVKQFLSDQNLMLLMMAAMRQETTQQIFEAAMSFHTMSKQGY